VRGDVEEVAGVDALRQAEERFEILADLGQAKVPTGWRL
jgi:hypothetical protein